MSEPLASIVITTFNRAAALPPTLEALDRQTVPSDTFEVLVVDDGSTDETAAVLAGAAPSYELLVFGHDENRGVSAGRNTGIRAARGRFLIFLSDDLIVADDFVAAHLRTLDRFPGAWVVGGFRQLDDVTRTPFGRYLDELERGFEEGRKEKPVGPHLWEMSWPTARNMSLPRSDLDRIGLFDERFRTCCEDQDLAERAMAVLPTKFIYDDSIDCLHNDQAADLERYRSFQQRGARDTALFCALYPERHGQAPIARLNGPVSWSEGLRPSVRKLAKGAVASGLGGLLLDGAIRLAERVRMPEPVLRRAYRLSIGSATMRGWREGLAALDPPDGVGADPR